MKKIFKGIMPALVTPFAENNKTIIESSVQKLIDLHIKQGAEGFYVLGGTGEGIVMAREEREIMCELAVKYIAGRKPVINHIAAVNVAEAVELAKHSERVGCDAIAALPPVFSTYTADELYNYYKCLANSVNIPLIVYYHPYAQANMSAELIARIFEIDNVTGVKWSSNNFFELMKLKDITHGEMNIINGPDEMLVLGLAAGADAGIGSTYNMMLPEFVAIYNHFQNGELEKAREIQLKINRIIDLIIKNGVIPSVKYGVNLMGIEVGDAKFPMKQMDALSAKEYAAELKRLGWQPDGRVI